MKKRLVIAATSLALLLPPLFFHLYPDLNAPFKDAFKRRITGDEPHYLMILVSLIEDRDFDLHNNYLHPPAALADRLDLVKHHAWVVDTASRSVRVSMPGDTAQGVREYSRHGVGFPLLALPLALFLKVPPEFALRLVSLFMTLLALYLFYGFLGNRSAPQPYIKTLLLLAATPLWHYSGSLYTETTLTALLMLTIRLTLDKKSPYLVSALIFLGVTIKISFLMLYIPAACFYWKTDRKKAAALAVPLLIGALGHALWNHAWFFNLFMYNQKGTVGAFLDAPASILSRIRGYFLSPAHGLIFFAPFLLLLCRPGSARGLLDRDVGPWCLTWFLTVSCIANVYDGTAYGPRQLLPIIPLLALPVLSALDLRSAFRHQRLALALLALSLAVNLQSVLLNSHVYSAPVWVFIARLIGA